MGSLTDKNAQVRGYGLPEEVTEDKGCATGAVPDVEEQQKIPGTEAEDGEKSTLTEGSRAQDAILGEGSNSAANTPNPGNRKKIFVGGLPNDVTNEEFTGFFQTFGKITDSAIIRDAETRMSRGFGFVTFESKASVDSVLQNRRYDIKGRSAEVKLAIPKEEINADKPPTENLRCYLHPWYPCPIIPSIYGYSGQFNAFTPMPVMWRPSAAPQIHANYSIPRRYPVNPDIDIEEISRRSGVRITRPAGR